MKKTNLFARKLSLKTETLMPLHDHLMGRVVGGADTGAGEPVGGGEVQSKSWFPTSCLSADGGKCQITSFVC